MSSLKLYGSTSGYVEVAPEATAQNNSITIPNTAGTIAVKDASGNLEVGTGVTIAAPSSNTYTVSTNGSERLRIDSSGNVGIGTNNPRQKLTFGSLTASSTSTPDCIDLGATYSGTNASNLKLKLYTDGSEEFGFGASVNSRLDYVVPSNGNHVFYRGTTESARFNSSGNLVFASGNGIDFSAASGSATGITTTSSTLDDYEEGTFTPTLTGFTNEGIFQTAQYVKIGRLVNIFINIYRSANNMSFANPSSISNLPFTTITNFHTATSAEALTVGGAMQQISAYLAPTTPVIEIKTASDASDKRHLLVHAAYYANA